MSGDKYPIWFCSLGVIAGVALTMFARPLGKAKKAQMDKLGFSSIHESGWIFLIKATGGGLAGISLLVFIATLLIK